eukprot:TRINITY_DN16_c0_g4_i1.p1 TRINITY_DN16_c0_g4~~TRINITY_DN16_c0_g4_i1.p1  ORF type:complete len:113 (+),score=19.91 TRINITY_DN16_c0_g4_i1:29-340(+)
MLSLKTALSETPLPRMRLRLTLGKLSPSSVLQSLTALCTSLRLLCLLSFQVQQELHALRNSLALGNLVRVALRHILVVHLLKLVLLVVEDMRHGEKKKLGFCH